VLDGDVVRTHLSKGLGFSKEDRDTNFAALVSSPPKLPGTEALLSALPSVPIEPHAMMCGTW